MVYVLTFSQLDYCGKILTNECCPFLSPFYVNIKINFGKHLFPHALRNTALSETPTVFLAVIHNNTNVQQEIQHRQGQAMSAKGPDSFCFLTAVHETAQAIKSYVPSPQSTGFSPK